MVIRWKALRASVGKLTPDDVRGFYHEQYKMGSAVIAVAGDVDADAIRDELNNEFTGLDGSGAAAGRTTRAVGAAGIHAQLIDRNVAQATLILGSGGVARLNPDYYKLQVMNYILGGGGFCLAPDESRAQQSGPGLRYR